MPRHHPQTAYAAGRRFGRDTRNDAQRCEVSRLLGAFVLDKYAVVLLVELE